MIRDRATVPLQAGIITLFLCISALAAGCVATDLPQVTQPVTSPSDNKAYRRVVLDNGLEALLVSDPDTPKAAASLDVLAGSGDNPPGWAGLAHFLEHMLFLGTDKYPDAAEYERFITEHGGSRNAYTSFEHTNYFFDVDAAHFVPALDRFAQFFISPRFDAQYVQREKNAVEAEFQMGLKSDARRGLDVLQEVMNPAHPFSQFTVGNLETLADRPAVSVREKLIEFYRRHYAADSMRLVVLGAQSLDELEQIVESRFRQVPDRAGEPGEIDAPLFPPGDLPLFLRVQPQATERRLEVLFAVPEYRDDYRSKPLAYYSNLIGHEGEGSLLSALKEAGLAEGLAAGRGLSWRGGALFSISISLTDQGVAQHDSVLSHVFAYLDMLRGEGPQAWLYQEQARLAALRFRFREEVDPIHYVSNLANQMHYYDPADILRGRYLMEDYDAQMLREALSHLVPARALVKLVAPGVETDRNSGFYGVPYAVAPLDPAVDAGAEEKALAAAFHLPRKNVFIPEDVSLVEMAEDAPAQPRRVIDGDRQMVWFQQDDRFRTPKGAVYINFQSPAAWGTDGQARAGLYASLLSDAVNEFAYPAMLAGLDYSIYQHARGITLRISGYDDKQGLLLQRLVEVIAERRFDPERFANLRAEMIRRLENTEAQRPSSQAMQDLREALVYTTDNEDELIRSLRNTDLSALRRYVEGFWESARIETLVYGNYRPAMARQVAQHLAPLLPDTPATALPPLRVVELDPGRTVQYAVDIPHDDTVVAWYLQAANTGWHHRAATALTAQIMKSGFFQALRTEQQLGYVVSAFPWRQLEVPGLVMLVQSPSAGAPRVAAAMERFLADLQGGLDEAQYLRHREALVNDIVKPDENLWQRAEFLWQSIAEQQYDFDGREQLASAVRRIDRADWARYFNRVFLDEARTLQVIAPGSQGALPSGADALYRDAQAVRDAHGVYLVK